MSDDKISMEDLDRLADVIWWIRGYLHACRSSGEQSPFGHDHIDSLRKTRLFLFSSVDATPRADAREAAPTPPPPPASPGGPPGTGAG